MSGPWVNEAGLRWRQCEPFGVEIDGDLSGPLPDVTARRFVGLFRDHGLVVARNQSLDREQHNALMALVGPVIAQREGDIGFMRSQGGVGPATSELSFHADTAYTETPFEALSLHAVDVVDGASSTRFVNAEQALERLPAELRAVLEAHDADMMSAGLERLAVRLCDLREHGDPAYRNRLPSLRRNPRTGRRYIAVSEMHTGGLFDMAWEDSRSALNAVFAHLYAPEAIHEHWWRNGDLVIWDNVACQHGRGSLADAGTRVLQRVIVGSKSFPTPHIKPRAEERQVSA